MPTKSTIIHALYAAVAVAVLMRFVPPYRSFVNGG